MERLSIISSHLSPNPTFWALKNIEDKNFKQVTSLKNKTLVISGASRGIGLGIAKRAARDGANIAILAKTTTPHPKMEGTIFTAAKEIESLGGKALPIQCDIRYESQVEAALKQVIEAFGRIDILVNNASTISLNSTAKTTMKTFDLMNQINTRGTFLLSKLCIPYLLKTENPHILNIAPPFTKNPKWYGKAVSYTMTKFGMTMCTLGMAEEYKGQIGVNALWPKTYIATAAIKNVVGNSEELKKSRTEEIMGDAAYVILTSDYKQVNGNFLFDDEILGPIPLAKYNVAPNLPVEDLAPDGLID